MVHGTLHRPAVHNAFNAQLIEELIETFGTTRPQIYEMEHRGPYNRGVRARIDGAGMMSWTKRWTDTSRCFGQRGLEPWATASD